MFDFSSFMHFCQLETCIQMFFVTFAQKALLETISFNEEKALLLIISNEKAVKDYFIFPNIPDSAQ